MGYFKQLLQAEKPLLVDFYADWCEPCKWLEPILEELQLLLGDKVTVIKINSDHSPDIAEKYNVKSVPVLILFKNGEPVWRINGFKHAKELYTEINKHLLHSIS